jgi:hypothetical protein
MPFQKAPLIAGVALILVVGIGVLLMSGGKKKSKAAPIPPVSARAVVLPASRARTVVVPPCNTPVSATARNAGGGRPTPGATTVQLPAGSGVRTLLVPHCQPAKTGSTNAEGSIPSAAFVLGDSKRLAKDAEGRIESDGVIAESQLLLTEGSNASTIVVPPCAKPPAEQGRDSVLSAEKDNPDLAVGPAC